MCIELTSCVYPSLSISWWWIFSIPIALFYHQFLMNQLISQHFFFCHNFSRKYYKYNKESFWRYFVDSFFFVCFAFKEFFIFIKFISQYTDTHFFFLLFLLCGNICCNLILFHITIYIYFDSRFIINDIYCCTYWRCQPWRLRATQIKIAYVNDLYTWTLFFRATSFSLFFFFYVYNTIWIFQSFLTFTKYTFVSLVECEYIAVEGKQFQLNLQQSAGKETVTGHLQQTQLHEQMVYNRLLSVMWLATLTPAYFPLYCCGKYVTGSKC